MTAELVLDSEGRVALPSELRRQLGIDFGDVLVLTALADGNVIARAKNLRLANLAGTLTRPNQPKVTVEQMQR